MRREIETLNERLTGDGQAVEGADATKGALKAKGLTFPASSVGLINLASQLFECLFYQLVWKKKDYHILLYRLTQL